MEQFVRAARGVSQALTDAGAPDEVVDVEAVLASLTPEQRAVVDALVHGAETGELPEGPVGDVFRYVRFECPA